MAGTARADSAGGAIAPPPTQRVWDPLVRIFHWSLVAAFAIAWLTADEVKRVHEWAGYAVAGLVAFRVVWGIVGSRHARFVTFVRSPLATIAYLRDMVGGREARYLGHNPAGAAMIIVLLFGLAGVAVTGWMMTLDTYWGVDWVEEVHEVIANALLVLVVLHVAGVVLASVRHGENLARAMVTGRKRVMDDDPHKA